MTIDFNSPSVIDAILGFVALEALAIFVLFPKSRRASDVWLTLISGAALMLAMRVALSDGGPLLMAGALGAALVAHLLYLRVRLRF